MSASVAFALDVSNLIEVDLDRGDLDVGEYLGDPLQKHQMEGQRRSSQGTKQQRVFGVCMSLQRADGTGGSLILCVIALLLSVSFFDSSLKLILFDSTT